MTSVIQDEPLPAQTPRSGQNVPVAAAMMVAGTGFFAVLGALVKAASDEATPMQAVLYRSIFSGLPLAAWMGMRGISLWSPRWRLLLIRAGAGFAALFLYMWGLSHLPLADVVSLQQTAPVFVAGLSIVLLRERPRAWFYPLAGLCLIGAMLVIRPTRGMLSAPSAVPLLSAVFSAFAYVSVRSLTRTEPSIRIVAWFVAVSTVGALPFCVADWRWLSWRGNLLLASAGLMATGGQLLMTAAYKRAPAWIVGAFAYASVPLGWLLGIAFWGEQPDAVAGVGIAIIVGVGVLMARLVRPSAGAKWAEESQRSGPGAQSGTAPGVEGRAKNL